MCWIKIIAKGHFWVSKTFCPAYWCIHLQDSGQTPMTVLPVIHSCIALYTQKHLSAPGNTFETYSLRSQYLGSTAIAVRVFPLTEQMHQLVSWDHIPPSQCGAWTAQVLQEMWKGNWNPDKYDWHTHFSQGSLICRDLKTSVNQHSAKQSHCSCRLEAHHSNSFACK